VSLSNIAIIKGGGQTIGVNEDDLRSVGTIAGSGGTLLALSNLDLSGLVLQGIVAIRTSDSDTNIVIAQTDLGPGGSITGGKGNNTLSVAGPGLDLSKTNISKFQLVQLGDGQTLSVGQGDIASGIAIGGTANDVLQAAEGNLDLTKTTLS